MAIQLATKTPEGEPVWVRDILNISMEKKSEINVAVGKAAAKANRTPEYITQVLVDTAKLCETNEELAYASYVVGVMLGRAQ